MTDELEQAAPAPYREDSSYLEQLAQEMRDRVEPLNVMQEAVDHMYTLQDMTISSRLLQHTSKYVSDANGSIPGM